LPNPVNAACSVVKKRLALSGGVFLRYAFEGIPDRHVRIRRFINRKIAFEHAPVDAEFFYAELEVGCDFGRNLCRCRLLRTLVPILAGAGRTDSSEFYDYVRAT